jgi:peptidoglycan/LPS O-acetylase OafA/YrhL
VSQERRQSQPETMKNSRSSSLDGLRGLTCLTVVFHHSCGVDHNLPYSAAWNSFCTLGFFGGHIFLMLSGFFITKSLLNSRNLETKNRHAVYRNFLWRRHTRLLPLYFLALIICCILLPYAYEILTNKPASRVSPSPERFASYVFLLSNFSIAQNGFFMNPFEVTWTLCVQEQFYLFWIPIAIYCGSFFRKSFLFCCAALPIGLRIFSPELNLERSFVHVSTFLRMDAIAIGCLIAMSQGYWKHRRFPIWIFAAIFLGYVVALISFPISDYDWHVRIGYTLLNIIGFLGITIILQRESRSLTTGILEHSALVWLGQRSYSIYLIHGLVILTLRYSLWAMLGKPETTSLLRYEYLPIYFGVGILINACIASLSWKYLELPIQNFRLSKATTEKDTLKTIEDNRLPEPSYKDQESTTNEIDFISFNDSMTKSGEETITDAESKIHKKTVSPSKHDLNLDLSQVVEMDFQKDNFIKQESL